MMNAEIVPDTRLATHKKWLPESVAIEYRSVPTAKGQPVISVNPPLLEEIE